MTRRWQRAAQVCALAYACCLSPSTRCCRAQVTILTNARVYKVTAPSQQGGSSDNQWADAVAYDTDSGRIVAVGTDAEVNEEAENAVASTSTGSTDASILTVDLAGRLVLPGFQDIHLHAVEAGVNEGVCFFDEKSRFDELEFYFEDCEDGGRFADQGWYVGGGIDISYVLNEIASNPNRDTPRQILDKAFPNDPVLILDNLGHGAVANTKALEIAGYTTMQGNPVGGVLNRHPTRTNELTGIVLENAQQKLRDAAFPASSTTNQDTAYRSLLQALETLAANGITSVSDAGGFWRQAQVESWARAEKNNVLTVRAKNALYVYPDVPIGEQLPDLKQRFTNDPSKLSSLNHAKVYVDGILGLQTAALEQEYLFADDLPQADRFGFEYFGDSANLFNVSMELAHAGFQLNYHVVGDRAALLALNAIEKVNEMESATKPSLPHRLTHCYMVDPSVYGKAAEIGAVMDFQIAPSSVSREFTKFASDELIGTQRASRLLPAVEIHEAGATVTISSDWDADILSPLLKIETLLNRPSGKSFADVETVLPLMTRIPGETIGTGAGSIEVGKFADLAIISDNFIEFADTRKIASDARVEMTVFNGKVVFDPLGIAGEPKGKFPVDDSSAILAGGQCGWSFAIVTIASAALCVLL